MSLICYEIDSGVDNCLNFKFIKDGTISGLSSSELDVLVVTTTEKALKRNSIKSPNIDNQIPDNFEMCPELDFTINQMTNIEEEEMKAKQARSARSDVSILLAIFLRVYSNLRKLHGF